MKVQLFAILAACTLQVIAASGSRKASAFKPTNADNDIIEVYQTVQKSEKLHRVKSNRVRSNVVELPKNHKNLDKLATLIPELAYNLATPEDYLLSKIQEQVKTMTPKEHKKMWANLFESFKKDNKTGKTERHFTKALEKSPTPKTATKLISRATTNVLNRRKNAIAAALVLTSAKQHEKQESSDYEQIKLILSPALVKRMKNLIPTWANVASGSWNLTQLRNRAYAYLKPKFDLKEASARAFEGVEFLIENASLLFPNLDQEADPVAFLTNVLVNRLPTVPTPHNNAFVNVLNGLSLGTITQAYVDAVESINNAGEDLTEPRLAKYAFGKLVVGNAERFVTAVYDNAVTARVAAKAPLSKKAKKQLRDNLNDKAFKKNAITHASKIALKAAEDAIETWKVSGKMTDAVTGFLTKMQRGLTRYFKKNGN